MNNIENNKKDEELLVKISDFDNEDDLVLLSKEIEQTTLDDTINLSKYLNEVVNTNNECLIK